MAGVEKRLIFFEKPIKSSLNCICIKQIFPHLFFYLLHSSFIKSLTFSSLADISLKISWTPNVVLGNSGFSSHVDSIDMVESFKEVKFLKNLGKSVASICSKTGRSLERVAYEAGISKSYMLNIIKILICCSYTLPYYKKSITSFTCPVPRVVHFSKVFHNQLKTMFWSVEISILLIKKLI